jgi:hypothetical protein
MENKRLGILILHIMKKYLITLAALLLAPIATYARPQFDIVPGTWRPAPPPSIIYIEVNDPDYLIINDSRY